MTLYLLSYNNYYDRIIKTEATLQDYDDYVIYTIPNANFHVADGINTTHIVGGPNIYDGSANYLIAVDNWTIHSRWFIIENDKTRGGQYNLLLHRDVIADYYDTVINAPCFIEKATLDNDNPLIFNQEDMTFNQIKTSEKPIKDMTQCPWIVGYFNKEYFSEAKTFSIPIETYTYSDTYASLDDIPFADAVREGGYYGELQGPVGIQINNHFTILGTGDAKYQFRCYSDYTYTANVKSILVANCKLLDSPEAATWKAATKYIMDRFNNDSDWRKHATNYQYNTASRVQEFLNTYPVSGKTIRVGTAASGYTYYKITRNSTIWVQEHTYGPEPGTVAYDRLKEVVTDSEYFKIEVNNKDTFKYNYTTLRYQLSLEELPDPAAWSFTIPANSERSHLNDSPYDMFAIPYGATTFKHYFEETSFDLRFKPDPELGLKAANELATAMGGIGNNFLFDLQLLPYCPIPEIAGLGPRVPGINSNKLTYVKDFILINRPLENDARVYSQVIFFPKKSDFSFTSDAIYDIEADASISLSINITEPKIQALCDTYRIVSPNYNGQFEFNAAKNGGVRYYEIDCTYKPYSPYIHVCPNFGKLYGKDFNDARGLVCGGDFSLPTITDQWITYEINNKNYLNTFNRQIENMDINNKYQRQREVIGAVTGAVSAGVSGGMTGGMLTGKPGAGVGVGLATAAVSGIAAGYDISVNDRLRAEAIDYTKDQFGYQLGNIQALPYSLNRVSAFNINNKVFPIVEYYTCTDIEKQALRDKIKYNGMTVMVIGNIINYLREEPSYIKGQIIRFDNNELDDFHIAAAISEEINKGVFI